MIYIFIYIYIYKTKNTWLKAKVFLWPAIYWRANTLPVAMCNLTRSVRTLRAHWERHSSVETCKNSLIIYTNCCGFVGSLCKIIKMHLRCVIIAFFGHHALRKERSLLWNHKTINVIQFFLICCKYSEKFYWTLITCFESLYKYIWKFYLSKKNRVRYD